MGFKVQCTPYDMERDRYCSCPRQTIWNEQSRCFLTTKTELEAAPYKIFRRFKQQNKLIIIEKHYYGS